MNMAKIMGRTTGVVLFAGATMAVWFWPKSERAKPTPEPIRPVRSFVVSSGLKMPDMHFAARVRAENSRALTFKQPGRLIKIAFDNGARVKKGTRLAWLDPIDCENRLAVAKAQAEKDRLTYTRKVNALRMNGVSKEEVSQAEAALKSAEASVKVAQRALDDTVIYAPFDGIVARKIADDGDMIDSSTKILLFQDDVNVKIDAMVPETFVIVARALQINGDTDTPASVTFDSFPQESYPVRFVEYQSTSENNDSQSYVATFLLKKPDILNVLPGMSATITLRGSAYSMRDDLKKGYLAIPEAAVGAASDGSHFVWILEPDSAAGVFVAHRRTISLKGVGGRMLSVEKGLKEGERIATAGVTILAEGRKVSLLGEKASK